MKKRILMILVAVLSVFLFIQVKNYYNNRYVVSNTYYIKVPDEIASNLEDLVDAQGNIQEKGRDYTFKAYDEQGNARMLGFTIRTEDEDDLLKPGEYLEVQTSEALSLSEKRINKTEVPEKVLAYLD